MILFKPEMAAAILSGQKICTRRRGRKRWNVGAIHQCYTRMPWGKEPGKPFAKVRIVSVTREESPGSPGCGFVWPSGRKTEAEREGFASWVDFLAAYAEINGEAALRECCWRVHFAREDDR